MDIFTFVITVCLCFVGILFGAVLSHKTKDEIHSLKHHIPLIQMLLIVLIFVVLYLYFPFYAISVLLVLSFGFIYVFWNKNNLNFLDYIVLAMIFVISSLNRTAHLYITIIAFLFGIFTGALFYVMHTKHKKKTTKRLAHHRHSGKHLEFNELTRELFHKYKYFFFLSLAAYVVAQAITLIFG